MANGIVKPLLMRQPNEKSFIAVTALVVGLYIMFPPHTRHTDSLFSPGLFGLFGIPRTYPFGRPTSLDR